MIKKYLLCIIGSILLSITYLATVKTQRESSLWWSNLSVMEKEISFRSEQGLYYSYFKEAVSLDSIFDAFEALQHDNHTESPKKLNIFKRMNVLPEIILSIAYQKWFHYVKPIDFYEMSTIILQFWTPFSLLFIMQSMNNSLLETLIFSATFLLNNHAISRVVFALPLRENFGMPFWWLRTYGINLILQHIDTVFIQCLIFSYCNLMSLGLTCLIQAGSLFPITSPCAAILLSNMIFNGLKYFHKKDINNHQVQDRRWLNIRSCIRCTETLWGQVGFVVILYGLFTVLNPNEDASHILQFILHKFHLSDKWDFDTALYLCSQSFQHMDLEQYMMEIIGSKWILPSYAFGLVVLIKEMLSHYIGHKRIANNRFIRLYKKLSTEITQKSYTNLHEFRKKNEIHSLSRIQAWHLAYSFSFGFLAWSTVRMKYYGLHIC
ncbi:unnamed protein product [Heterobilharzia americana]|nr:unnamed protein product [Heterobilharzia americana]